MCDFGVVTSYPYKKSVSFTPLDIGFDLRLHETKIIIDAEINEIIFLNKNDKEEKFIGTQKEIIKILNNNGYKAIAYSKNRG